MTDKKEPKKIVKSLKQQITELLSNENPEDVDAYSSYCHRIATDIDKKTGQLKNPFMKLKSAKQLADLFKRVKKEGLVFDGKHISLQSTGIAFDYVAYKNKMLLAYPESMMDVGVVKEGDTFTLENENGQVKYKHTIGDAFKTADANNINGAFCIIKNKRGEFATLLSKEDIQKHKKVAKTSMIWDNWFKEMVLKTVIKKACKYHYDDIFEGMNTIDNESIDLDKSVVPHEVIPREEIDKVIKKIESFKTINELQNYYLGLAQQFIKNDDVFEAYNAQKELCKATK